VAPPRKQAETEKTNLVLTLWEYPAYSKVDTMDKRYHLDKRLVPVICLMAIFLFGCMPKKPSVIARVGPYEIQDEELFQRLQEQGEGADPQDVLDAMVQEMIVQVRAEQLGLDQKPNVLRAYRNLLADALRKECLEPVLNKIEISDEEIQIYYKTNIKNYTRSAQRRGAILYIGASEKEGDLREEGRLRMVEAREKALAQRQTDGFVGFGGMAVTYSEDQVTKYKGGDMGWFFNGSTHPRWPKKVLKTLFELEHPGAISEVLDTPKGYYLVKFLDQRPAEVQPLSSVQPSICNRLLFQRKQLLKKQFQENLRKEVDWEIFPKKSYN